MNPRIEIIEEKKLVGKKLTMSYANYRIGELWGSFMPRLKEISNSKSKELVSLVVYNPNHFNDFHLTNEFERWATIEVEDFLNVPAEMETFVLSSGLYAVFHYRGSTTGASGFYQNIFTVWMPNSEYELDYRPHFEIIGEKYKNNDLLSEEDIFIPIKQR
jgi:AraC family transcriptional regulator